MDDIDKKELAEIIPHVLIAIVLFVSAFFIVLYLGMNGII